ncbi:MAG: GTPase Era [Candidatus Scalindua sp. AMX11]|nr:MAG: GTPase Era [Candidatus Scalindua sp.]NOG85383.1 GTPase Era [Planctomycetota bacterium]RZV83982.1 MAG: GTPase Era [Candidatus Scalindua sp. SCAELEC01]TDE65734.1 MAG: GTPase Era [Candidatus Scalindua sp. AMX11]GJQ59661.1 MAG: GTPase Era [Candidatus Scalindua sp.]
MDEETSNTFKSGFVTMWGRPNVGKSTLLNTLVGEKVAIVSPRPQTTRNRVMGICEMEEGQIVFLDTPGILKKPKQKLDEYLVKSARTCLRDADVVLFVVDATSQPHGDDRRAAKLLRPLNKNILLVINKIDIADIPNLEERIDQFKQLGDFAGGVAVSATARINIKMLVDKILDLLPENPAYYPAGTVTDQQEKLSISEIIREQTLLVIRQEVPHGVAVVIDELTPRSNKLTYISATIFVEKPTHKQIIVGKKGEMLKEIGKVSRENIQKLLDTKVYLDLWVKLVKNWRKDENALRRFGYK